MSQHLTRRGFAVAVPVAVAATGVPAFAASAHADAELIALQQPWASTLLGLALCGPAHTAAENAFADAHKADPSRLRGDLEKEVGLDVAEAEWNGAVDANTEILDRIAATPARTLKGLLFKAKACAKADYYPDLADAIIDDLVAMAGGAHA